MRTRARTKSKGSNDAHDGSASSVSDLSNAQAPGDLLLGYSSQALSTNSSTRNSYGDTELADSPQSSNTSMSISPLLSSFPQPRSIMPEKETQPIDAAPTGWRKIDGQAVLGSLQRLDIDQDVPQSHTRPSRKLKLTAKAQALAASTGKLGKIFGNQYASEDDHLLSPKQHCKSETESKFSVPSPSNGTKTLETLCEETPPTGSKYVAQPSLSIQIRQASEVNVKAGLRRRPATCQEKKSSKAVQDSHNQIPVPKRAAGAQADSSGNVKTEAGERNATEEKRKRTSGEAKKVLTRNSSLESSAVTHLSESDRECGMLSEWTKVERSNSALETKRRPPELQAGEAAEEADITEFCSVAENSGVKTSQDSSVQPLRSRATVSHTAQDSRVQCPAEDSKQHRNGGIARKSRTPRVSRLKDVKSLNTKPHVTDCKFSSNSSSAQGWAQQGHKDTVNISENIVALSDERKADSSKQPAVSISIQQAIQQTQKDRSESREGGPKAKGCDLTCLTEEDLFYAFAEVCEADDGPETEAHLRKRMAAYCICGNTSPAHGQKAYPRLKLNISSRSRDKEAQRLNNR